MTTWNWSEKMQKKKRKKKKDVKHTVTREPLASSSSLVSCPLPAHSLSLSLSLCCPSWLSVVCVALEAPGTSNKTNNSIFYLLIIINKFKHCFIISRWIVVDTTRCARASNVSEEGVCATKKWRYYRSNVFFSYSFKILKLYYITHYKMKLYYTPTFLKYMF